MQKRHLPEDPNPNLDQSASAGLLWARDCHQAQNRAVIESFLSCSRATTSHLSWGAYMRRVRPWVRVAGRIVCGLGSMARRRWSGSRGLRTLPSMEHGSPKQTAEELTWRGQGTSRACCHSRGHRSPNPPPSQILQVAAATTAATAAAAPSTTASQPRPTGSGGCRGCPESLRWLVARGSWPVYACMRS